jgi:hypothetical protein
MWIAGFCVTAALRDASFCGLGALRDGSPVGRGFSRDIRLSNKKGLQPLK